MSSTLTIPAVVKADRYGYRAPRGGITIQGRYFKGGRFCWNAPADPIATPNLEVAASVPTRTTIAGFAYSIRPITIHHEVGSVAFAMDRKDTGHNYTIHRDIHGEVACTCPDFVLRREGSGTNCKHGKALVDLGLIEATAPRVLPTFATRSATSFGRDGSGETFGPSRKFSGPVRRRFEPSEQDMAAAAELLAWRA